MRVSLSRNFLCDMIRLGCSRQIEFVQPRDHFVPVGSPPVYSATGGTTPERPMSGTDSFRHQVLHVLHGRAHQDLVAKGTTGQRIDESERQGRRDLANLIGQDVRTNPDGAGDPGGKFLVPRQEDPIFGADAVDEGSIRSRFRVGGVIAHEPQPSCETPKHVIAEELHGARIGTSVHRTTAYSRSAPSPSRSIRSKRRRGASFREATPRPPARVGAPCPPSTWLLTNTFSSSARPSWRKDQMTVLPPSTRIVFTSRAARRSRSAFRSTSSLPRRRTSARGNERSHTSEVTINVAALPSRTRADSGVLPSESRTTRRGFRPFAYSDFTVSFGSSFRTVPTPTKIASTAARRRCTRRRSSSLLSRTPLPSESAIFPSTLIAALMITRGRTAIRWTGRITTLRVRSEVHLACRPAWAGGNHESPTGPRRCIALPSKSRGGP